MKKNKTNDAYNRYIIKSRRDNARARIETNQKQEIVRSYVYVEGDSDERFFKNYIDEDHCTVRHCGGKPKVWEQMFRDKQDITGNTSIIYIVDADLDNREEGNYSNQNVFTYEDAKDLESWIWFNSDFCQKYINEYAHNSKLKSMENSWNQNLKDKVTAEAKKVGILRSVDNENRFGLRFSTEGEEESNLRLLNFLDESFSFDTNKYLDILIQEHRLLLSERNKTNIRYKIREALSFIDDYFPKHVCTGHDLTQIFAAVFDSKHFSNSVNRNRTQETTRENIESSMRTMLDSFYFMRSNLCKKIIAYQNKYPNIRILKEKFCA